MNVARLRADQLRGVRSPGPASHRIAGADAGAELHVVDWPGGDPPLLCFHGLGGHAREWDGLAGALTDRRLVAIDQRGHGESDRATSYAMGGYVADAEAAARWLDAPAVVVGHSLGGAVAVSLAASRPELVDALIVVDIAPELTDEALAYLLSRTHRPTEFTDPAQAVATLRAANPYAVEASLARRVEHGLVEAEPGRWIWRYDPATQSPDPGILEGLWDRWRAVKAPTLLVHGARSPFLTAALAARMAEARPGVDVAAIPGAGHNAHSDQPDAFHTAVAGWLAGGDAGTSRPTESPRPAAP